MKNINMKWDIRERYNPSRQLIIYSAILIFNIYFYCAGNFNGIITFFIFCICIIALFNNLVGIDYRIIQIKFTSEEELIKYLRAQNIDIYNLTIDEYEYFDGKKYIWVTVHKDSEFYSFMKRTMVSKYHAH